MFKRIRTITNKLLAGIEHNKNSLVNQPKGQLKWKFKTERSVYSSPAIKDSVVYFGSDDGYLYAIDSQSGQKKWDFEIGRYVRSPAIKDGVVYVGGFDGGLYAIDSQSGQLKWNFKRSVCSRHIAIMDGVVYFGSSDNFLYAIDIQSGQLKWKFKTEGSVYSSPAIKDGVVYFGSYDSFLYAIDSHSGQLIWKFRTEGMIDTSPAIKDGVVYLGSWDHLYAIDSQSGQLKWKFKTEGSVYSPAIKDGVVYVGIDAVPDGLQLRTGEHGYLYAIDSQSGKAKWKFKPGVVLSSPTIKNGVVYVGTLPGYLQAIDSQSGQLKWKFEIQDGDVRSSPAIKYALPFPGIEGVCSSPAIKDGVVYVTSSDGYLFAIE